MGLVDIPAGQQVQIPVQGAELIRLMLGGVIEMSFAPPELECTIGTEFVIEGNGIEWFGAPDMRPPPDWGALTSLLWHQIHRLEALSDASLVIEFDNGSLVRIPPNEEHEAWSLAARDGSRAVCGPGGEITVWNAMFSSTDDESWFQRRG